MWTPPHPQPPKIAEFKFCIVSNHDLSHIGHSRVTDFDNFSIEQRIQMVDRWEGPV